MTRIIFMGTPDFAVPSLQALFDSPDYEVVGVVTQPDRPAGRGQKLQESPVKQAAKAKNPNLPILQPEKLRDSGVFEQLQALQPDVMVVAAFGQILRQKVLDLPKFGCINVHASLLPRWRGAAPIQAVIRAGDAESGITIMKMDAGLDTGPMLGARAIPIAADETGQSLHDKLAALGGPLLIEVLGGYLRGEVTPLAQPQGELGYAAMLKKEDGLIDWSEPAEVVDRHIRAYFPWPGTFTTWNGQTLKIIPAESGNPATRLAAGTAHPGEVIAISKNVIGIGTGSGLYVPYRVQLAGKPPVDVGAFLNGHADFVGAVLGRS